MKIGNKKIIVFYHAECPDGFSGAWVAWRKLGNKAQYIPLGHNVPRFMGLKNKLIYFVDIVFPYKDLQRIKKNNTVIVLDHHETVKEATQSADDYLYGTNKSGTGLAWQYFYPKKKMPKFLEYIQAQDLFKVRGRDIKNILAYAMLFMTNFSSWSQIVKNVENQKKRKEYAQKGSLILKYRGFMIEEMLVLANKVNFLGHKIYVVNSPIARQEFDTELAAAVMKKFNTKLVALWSEHNGHLKVSLRSRGNIDASKIAVKFGGGGHKHACAFRLKQGSKLPWKYIK